MGCDANGRTPAWYSHVTGDRLVGEPDSPGFALCEVADAHALWLPSTFSECHSGPDFTHVHPSGAPSRIDYFALSASPAECHVRTWVDKTIDLLNTQADHFALCMDLRMVRIGAGGETIRCRKKRNDIRRLQEPVIRDRVCARLAVLPLPAWETDVNAHADMFQRQLEAILDDEIPLQPDAPRSWYLSDEAWSLRQRKQGLKRTTSNRRRDFRLVVCGLALDAWNPPAGCCLLTIRFLLRKACLLHDLISGAVTWCTTRMRSVVRQDKARHLERLAASFGRCAPQEIMTRLRQLQLGRRKVKTWRAHLPGLLKSDGARTIDRVDVDQVWLEYFNCLEAGEILPMQDLLESEARPRDLPDVVPDERVFPTRLEIEQCLREVKPRKAAGLDCLPGDVLRVAAKPVARLLEPLIFKSIAHVRQPVQWRGGMLVAAWKGSGPTEQVNSYRSLYVGSAVGKTYHRLMRNKLAGHVDSYLGPCHFGAKQGSPVTHASHLVLAHEQWALSEDHSSSALFLDTRSAYYRVVREAATGMREPRDLDVCVTRVLQHFAMPPDTWATILRLVHRGGALKDAGVSQHLCAVAEDLHSDAFFVTQFASRRFLSRTRAGSRPGESLADVIFSVIYHQVLQQIRQEVHAHGLAEPLAYDGIPSPWIGDPVEEVWMTDSTWADDTAFVAKAQDPETLLLRTARLAEHVIDASRRHAMEPNLKKGKTEVMVSLRGKARKKVALKWFSSDGAVLKLCTQTAGTVTLNVVASYVHLGFQVDRGVTFKPEVLRRLSQASAACREIRSLVLQNVHIPRPARAQLFSALVDATYFNLELWQQDIGQAWDKLVAGHSRLQRTILAKEMPAMESMKLTPADATYLLGTPSLLCMLRAKRLRYLITMVSAAPPALWAVLKCERGWLGKLVEDLAWLKAHSAGPWPEVMPETWPMWWHEIKDQPGRFKRQIGTAVARFTVDSLPAEFMREADKAMQQEALSQGRAGQRRQAVEKHFCVVCQASFCTPSNLACHFRHVHGRRADHLYYSGGTRCCGCGKQHHTIDRILVHLKTVPTCWRAVRRAGLVSDQPHAGEVSRLRLKEAFENPKLVPACPTEGPQLLYDDGDSEILLPLEKEVLLAASVICGAVEDWVRKSTASCDVAARHQLWAVVKAGLQRYPFYQSEFKEVLCRVHDEVVDLQPRVLHW